VTQALILRLVAALWKPVLALLAALGLYAKGRADARAAADARKAQDFKSTRSRTSHAPVHTDPAAARQRMRNRDPDKR
jgi:hypothetical protein